MGSEGSLTLRFDPELMRRLRQQAEDENRSLSNLVGTYLETALHYSTDEHREKLKAKPKRRSRSPR